MIDKDKIIETVIANLKKLPVDHYLDMRTYKRNRFTRYRQEERRGVGSRPHMSHY